MQSFFYTLFQKEVKHNGEGKKEKERIGEHGKKNKTSIIYVAGCSNVIV